MLKIVFFHHFSKFAVNFGCDREKCSKKKGRGLGASEFFYERAKYPN
jgi:hypothetical protein